MITGGPLGFGPIAGLPIADVLISTAATVTVLAGVYRLATANWGTHDPDEVDAFAIDWSDRLDSSETIASSSWSYTTYGGGGGGAGGCKSITPGYFDGGAGGGTHLAGGAGGTNAGTVNGTAGANAVGARCGSGGGGGAAHATASGNGGAGGTPGGGGGGGAGGLNGNTAGAGGAGGRGEIWVVTYLTDTATGGGSGASWAFA